MSLGDKYAPQLMKSVDGVGEGVYHSEDVGHVKLNRTMVGLKVLESDLRLESREEKDIIGVKHQVKIRLIGLK